MSYVRFYSTASFSLNIVDNMPLWNGTIQYSTNASTWTNWNGTSAISAAVGTSRTYNLYLRGINNRYISGDQDTNVNGFEFTGTQPIDSEGNIESLLDYQMVDNNQHPPMDGEAFLGLFRNATLLRTAPELGAVSLTDYCYEQMFYGCSSLTTAPALPATILAIGCYQSMFVSCYELTTAPELPATSLAPYCYAAMFSDCSSLITPPSLPALNLANYCYRYMFNGCSMLTSIPELPALKLTIRCYDEMFYDSGISISTILDSTHTTEFRIPTVGTGSTTASITDWNYEMFGEDEIEPELNTTYYINVPVISSAIDYMVTKSELSSIATAIRGKTGNNIPLTYPDDFISELNNIQPGEMTTFLSGSSLPASSLGVDGDLYTYTGS